MDWLTHLTVGWTTTSGVAVQASDVNLQAFPEDATESDVYQWASDHFWSTRTKTDRASVLFYRAVPNKRG